MTSVRKRRIVCFLAVVMAFGIVFTAMPYAAYAAGSGLNFDTTDVLDDLKSADNFNILNYPYDGTGRVKHPEILNVASTAIRTGRTCGTTTDCICTCTTPRGWI